MIKDPLQMGELRDATNTILEANNNNIKKVAQAVGSYGQSYTQVVSACQEQALDTTREITNIVCDSQKQILGSLMSAWINGMVCGFAMVGIGP